MKWKISENPFFPLRKFDSINWTLSKMRKIKCFAHFRENSHPWLDFWLDVSLNSGRKSTDENSLNFRGFPSTINQSINQGNSSCDALKSTLPSSWSLEQRTNFSSTIRNEYSTAEEGNWEQTRTTSSETEETFEKKKNPTKFTIFSIQMQEKCKKKQPCVPETVYRCFPRHGSRSKQSTFEGIVKTMRKVKLQEKMEGNDQITVLSKPRRKFF